MTLAVLALLPPRARVTKANYDRIEEGMTREQVEKLLGGRGDEWIGRNVIVWFNDWDHAKVFICFDDRDRVVEKTWEPPLTFLERLYDWLGL